MIEDQPIKSPVDVTPPEPEQTDGSPSMLEAQSKKSQRSKFFKICLIGLCLITFAVFSYKFPLVKKWFDESKIGQPFKVHDESVAPLNPVQETHTSDLDHAPSVQQRHGFQDHQPVDQDARAQEQISHLNDHLQQIQSVTPALLELEEKHVKRLEGALEKFKDELQHTQQKLQSFEDFYKQSLKFMTCYATLVQQLQTTQPFDSVLGDFTAIFKNFMDHESFKNLKDLASVGVPNLETIQRDFVDFHHRYDENHQQTRKSWLDICIGFVLKFVQIRPISRDGHPLKQDQFQDVFDQLHQRIQDDDMQQALEILDKHHHVFAPFDQSLQAHIQARLIMKIFQHDFDQIVHSFKLVTTLFEKYKG